MANDAEMVRKSNERQKAKPSLAVACASAEPSEWARAVVDSLPPDDSAVRSHWLRVVAGGSIPQQSFSEVSLEQALALIR